MRPGAVRTDGLLHKRESAFSARDKNRDGEPVEDSLGNAPQEQVANAAGASRPNHHHLRVRRGHSGNRGSGSPVLSTGSAVAPRATVECPRRHGSACLDLDTPRVVRGPCANCGDALDGSSVKPPALFGARHTFCGSAPPTNQQTIGACARSAQDAEIFARGRVGLPCCTSLPKRP